MNPASMAFLFLDESMDESLDLASLTGLLVPLSAYGSVRDAMCKLVWDVIGPPPNTVPAPIELHGRKLLPEFDNLPQERADVLRLEVMRRAVSIVNDHALKITRVCYLNRTEIAGLLKTDPKLYGVNFFGILSGLQEDMETILILPIMDGVPDSTGSKKAPRIDRSLIRAFAQMVRSIHHLRQSDAVKNALSIRNAHNLAEPLFGDSAHSTLLQLVDLVSYLLLQLDRDELEPIPQNCNFKRSLIDLAKNVDAQLLSGWKGTFSLTEVYDATKK